MYGMTIPLNSAMLVRYGERDGRPAHSNWYNRDENQFLICIELLLQLTCGERIATMILLSYKVRVGCTFGHSHYLSWSGRTQTTLT